MLCAICGHSNFRDQGMYQDHLKRHTTGRTKIEIVKDFESYMIDRHLVKQDVIEYVGTVMDIPFYFVRVMGCAFNGDVMSLEYMKQQGVTE